MNKAELTAAIVKKTGFTKKDAEKAIAAVTDVITETLAAGEKVQIEVRSGAVMDVSRYAIQQIDDSKGAK